jgi:hypothetical protein
LARSAVTLETERAKWPILHVYDDDDDDEEEVCRYLSWDRREFIQSLDGKHKGMEQWSKWDENIQMNLYVVRTVHFEMKLYNDQRNTQVFNLFM